MIQCGAINVTKLQTTLGKEMDYCERRSLSSLEGDSWRLRAHICRRPPAFGQKRVKLSSKVVKWVGRTLNVAAFYGLSSNIIMLHFYSRGHTQQYFIFSSFFLKQLLKNMLPILYIMLIQCMYKLYIFLKVRWVSIDLKFEKYWLRVWK